MVKYTTLDKNDSTSVYFDEFERKGELNTINYVLDNKFSTYPMLYLIIAYLSLALTLEEKRQNLNKEKNLVKGSCSKSDNS